MHRPVIKQGVSMDFVLGDIVVDTVALKRSLVTGKHTHTSCKTTKDDKEGHTKTEGTKHPWIT